MSFRFKGVTLQKTSATYTAIVNIDGKPRYLGLWKGQEDAAVAYDEALIFQAGLFRSTAGRTPFACESQVCPPLAVTMHFLRHT